MADVSNSITSLTLLGRLRDNPDDDASWREFVDRYGGMIQRWCRGWGLQEADALDVTQNVLLKIAKQMRRFEYRSGGRFRGWLRTVAYHAWCDYLNSQRNATSGSGADAVAKLLNSIEARDDFLRNVEEECDRNVLDDAMAVVRQRVEPHTWKAFVGMAIDDKSGPELAKELGMKAGTVYVAKSRVQKMLHDEIQRLDQDD